MNRERAIQQAIYEVNRAEEAGFDFTDYAPDARAVLAASDAHDAANGVHRISLDDAPAERMARVLVEEGAYGVPWEDASEDDRAECIALAVRVLAAAVKEDG